MKKKIYYRRKSKSIVMEGCKDGKAILIWTIPEPEKLISLFIEKPSDFMNEKLPKIIEKINSLDIKHAKEDKDVA